MAKTPDPFVGTWTLNPQASEFSPHHQPKAGTMRFERTGDGPYLLTAEGLNGKGERVTERPQRFVPDGQPYPLPDFPGLSAVCTQPDERTLHGEVRREDGSIAGKGVYVVSPDGRSLRATTVGFDSQLREFKQVTEWKRLSD